VNESVQRVVWQYDLDENLNISNKKAFIKFTDHGLDGMRVNNKGHVFITRYGAGKVLEVSPNGKLLNSYQLKGQHPTNLAFNETQSKVYITMQKRGAIEVIEL